MCGTNRIRAVYDGNADGSPKTDKPLEIKPRQDSEYPDGGSLRRYIFL